jgi:hypothetical protein
MDPSDLESESNPKSNPKGDPESDPKGDPESDLESDSESDSDLGADLEEPPDLLPSEPSSGTSTPQPKHSIGARIQAISFLELNIPHFEITAKTGISKA